VEFWYGHLSGNATYRDLTRHDREDTLGAIDYHVICISLRRWPIIGSRSMRRSLNAALFAVFTSLTLLACASSALPQFKPNRSDQDVNAIGHRHIGDGVNFFSREKELALGKQLAQEVERSSRMIDDPVASEYLNRLAQNIAKNSDAKIPVNVRIIDSNEINAFTLPGGYQYVNRGLILATNSEAELAGVLAYDIAHTALRTGTNQATKGELMQLSSTPGMVATPFATWAAYGTGQGLDLAVPLTFLKFSREAVNAADFFAMQYLYKAGYDAEAYPRLLERTLQQPKNQNIPKPFDTHPPLPERLKAIREEIARLLPPRPDEITSSPDFETVKERLRALKPQTPSAPGTNPDRPTLRNPTEAQKP
jgi:beta-barrel assembly-enhancing protease